MSSTFLPPAQTVLVPEASEFSQWEPEGAESVCPITAIIPVWRNLTTLDLSHNCVSSIDGSVVRSAAFRPTERNLFISDLEFVFVVETDP